VPAGLADRYQRVVRRWQTDSIGREDLRGDSGVHASEGEIDLALARLVHEGLLAPFADQPFRFRIVPARESADLESAYAGDDAEALKAAAIQEQSGRYQEMRTLEAALADGCLSRRREERFRKDLAELGAVYAAQWLELECAVGHEAAEEVRRKVEECGTDLQNQLLLPFGEV